MDEVKPEKISWHWKNRIARGKITLIVGDPGLGKSFLTTDLAARTSTGAKWPDDSGNAPQGSVAMLTAEDGLADTMRPRLDSAGADCTKIKVLDCVRGDDGDTPYERGIDLDRDIDRIATAIREIGDCRLVTIDPISSYLGGTDSHKNADVRAVLSPLAKMAEELDVAVVCVSHLRKGEGSAIHRTMGSMAFVAAARAAFAVVRDPDDDRRRLFLPIKNNLGNDSTGLAFELSPRHGIDSVPCVAWMDGAVETTADEAMAGPRRKSKKDDAADWLRSTLADGPVAATDILEKGKAEGFSERTLRRTLNEIGGGSEKGGFGSGWSWTLNHEDCTLPP